MDSSASSSGSTGRTKRFRWSRKVAFVLVAVFVIASIIHERGSNEPDTFGVQFRNDLGSPVVLALCDTRSKCAHPYYRNRIPAGKWHRENISTGLDTEWAVETEDGKLLRCLELYWQHFPGHTPEVLLSSARQWANPCPSS